MVNLHGTMVRLYGAIVTLQGAMECLHCAMVSLRGEDLVSLYSDLVSLHSAMVSVYLHHDAIILFAASLKTGITHVPVSGMTVHNNSSSSSPRYKGHYFICSGS